MCFNMTKWLLINGVFDNEEEMLFCGKRRERTGRLYERTTEPKKSDIQVPGKDC